MDPNTGQLYPSVAAAEAASVENPVEVVGTPGAVQRISKAVKAQHKKRRRGEAGFDRWLAEHDREVAARALEAAADAHAQAHGKRYPSGLIMSTATSRFLNDRAMLVRTGKVLWNG